MTEIKFSIILILLAITTNGQNNLFIPPLPEMSFAPVVDKSKFLGDRWSYMETGNKDAPAIICMHGYGGSSNDWRYQLFDLSDTYRVIAWNAPGYMLSDELKTNYPVAKDYADALLDFITALKLDKVYLVGNSFGSRIAQCFAYYYPEKVIKISLIGPSAGKRNITFEERMKTVNFRYDQIKDGGYAFTNKRVEALLAPNSSSELIELTRSGMRGVNPSMFMKGVNFILAEDHYPQLIATKVTMPMLLVAGTEDKISPIPINADSIHHYLKNSQLEILKGIGHLPHIESPQFVNGKVRAFFGVTKPKSEIKFNLNAYQQSVYKVIDSLTTQIERMVLNQDTVAMQKFYPDDMIITNPFGQMINKATMIQRVKDGIIKYNEFEKIIEHFTMPDDKTAIVAGKEKVTPTKDANRTDAGKHHERRFTEVWVYRQGTWVRLIRHASNI
ncbi:MAG: alpha/beta fold hydrolase [Bacteroidales bacterium]|nr:alpha/beta fold hydrolase [Bacteroidales bacterium]